MIQDLIRGDVAKQVVQQQDSLLVEKDKELTLKDSVVLVYQQKDTIYKATTAEFIKLETTHQRAIQSMTALYQKEKRRTRVLSVFAGALLLGLLVK